jgi:hypothetical protein
MMVAVRPALMMSGVVLGVALDPSVSGNIVEPLTGRWRSLLDRHIPASQRKRL